MRILGNILWLFLFGGLFTAMLTWLLGGILTLTVVASPLGLGLMKYGKFLFWPFGNSMVSKSDLKIKQNIVWKSYAGLMSILYFPFGLVLVVIAVFQIIACFVSIIQIPVALVLAKSLSTFFNPVNKKCVAALA
jgi:uncharacterized membrane protein YccF (DUF307 family)